VSIAPRLPGRTGGFAGPGGRRILDTTVEHTVQNPQESLNDTFQILEGEV
jgi:hypothetical protein